MKLSELIERLERLKAEYGDFEVFAEKEVDEVLMLGAADRQYDNPSPSAVPPAGVFVTAIVGPE